MKKECRKTAQETEMVRILVLVENTKVSVECSSESSSVLFVVFIVAVPCGILLPEKGHLHQI